MAQKGYIKNSLTKDLGAPEMANMFQGIFGASGIMSLYGNLACVKVNNNTVRMSSGAYNLSGHLLGIAKGTTEDLTIDSGTSGQNRNDLIVAEFVRNGGGLGVDTLHFTVVKGTSTSGTAVDPALTQQDINAAGVTRQEALYRVKVAGTEITQIDLLATQLPNLNLVELELNALKQSTSGRFVLPNGLKMAWGKDVLTYANTSVAQKTIAFPFTFSAAPVVIIAGQTTSNNAAGELSINFKIRDVTTSNFVGIVHSPAAYLTSGNVVKYPIDWIAIGY